MFWNNKKADFYEQNASDSGSGERKILEEEKKRIWAIVNSFPDGILIFDEKNKLSLVNFKAEIFLDITSNEVLNRDILALSQFPRFQPLVTLLGGGIRKILREEVKIKENLILEVSVMPIMIEGQKTDNLVALHDITQMKLVEKMKSEFVTVAAHQLRTPASATKWTTKMLLDGDLGELTKEQKEAVEKAYIANNKMINLVNALLNVSQIEDGKYVSKLVLAEIEPMILFAINNQEEAIKTKNLRIKFQKPEQELPKIMIDKEKMEIAISNLIDNAIRYTPANGIVIIAIIKKDKEIEIQIKDTGYGIPQSDHSKVFSKFFRADNIMKIYTEGTGLGLFIAKNIIEAHGGEIRFESEQNKGSSFYFTVPIKEKFGEYLSKDFY